MKDSSLFSLNWKDVAKSFVMAFLGTFVTALIQSLQAQHLPTLNELGGAAVAGLITGLTYLLKNFLSNSNGEVAKKEIK
jgi:uncharacterized membrane protein YjjP (DUF1212 family)